MNSNLCLHTVQRRLFTTARRTFVGLQRKRQVAASSTTTSSGWIASTTASTQPRRLPLYPQRDGNTRHLRREFHLSRVLLEEEEEKELSAKEKKKLLKAKAKAAAAAAAEQEGDDDAAAEKKKALQEKLAAKKAAAAAEQEAAEPISDTETPPPATPEENADAAAPAPEASSPEYSTPELTQDAAKHKAGLDDPDVPFYQNPLHHNNPEMAKTFREDFDSDEAFENATVPSPPLDLGDGRVAAPEYLHALADEIVNLTMLEMNELVNKIADHYGFHEGMLSPDDGEDGEGGDDDDDGAAGEGSAEQEEAKTAFDIKLVEYDAKAKIKVIKEVRALAGLGLKEAKEMVEGAPKVIHKGVKKEEAEEIKAKLEELGATIEIV